MPKNGKMKPWSNERRQLKDLIPWEGNPRQLTETQAQYLRESIQEFGYSQPIEIDPSDTIVDGHQREALMALMKEYGPGAEIDVRVAPFVFTEKQRQKYTVFKGESAIGEWDLDSLANWDIEVNELVEWGFDIGKLGLSEVWDYTDLDEELEKLDGFQEIDVKLTVPVMHEKAVVDWLANGEAKTAPGMGKGVLRRCGLL